MQLLPCPFCGHRDEREFFYAGDMGKQRPATQGDVSNEQWTKYLYEKRNTKGINQEVWMHLSCSEVFALERDTASMEVIGTTSLRQTAS